MRPPSQLIKAGMMAHACQSSDAGSVSRRIEVQARLGINVRPYLKNNKSKKG
jgi:hypothetical protein